MDFASVKMTLETHGVLFDPGLSATEMSDVEHTFSFRFPPDLADFLRQGVPVSHGFVDWRRGECTPLRDAMDWPFDGICKDIENNGFWLDDWGARPDNMGDRFRIAGNAVASAPTMIPVCGHRFIPADPHEDNNPIFSIYQADVMLYGYHLRDYLAKELKCDLGVRDRPVEAKAIPFWSKLANK